MKITRLQIFDLDDTLLRVPSYTSRTQVENFGYYFSGPYEYYDHPISLDETISNIQLISPVYDAWKRGREDSSCVQVLITHRVEELAGQITQILGSRGVSFDRSFYLGRVTPKVDMTKGLLEELPDLEEVEVYEDSVHQIIQYQDFFDRNNTSRYLRKLPYGSTPALKIKIYVVDKSKMFRIENLKLSEETKIRLI